jgi:zinc protease
MNRFNVLAAVALVVWTVALNSDADAEPRREVRVAYNAFVIPDPNAVSVSGWLIVGAGCSDEADGNCKGIAHYLEHLHLIGRGPSHRPTAIALVPGGTGNGQTTHRSTSYSQKFPVAAADLAGNLDKLFMYFAGTLKALDVDAAAAIRERDVVQQEYQRGAGSSPLVRYAMELNARLLPDEPMGQRVIGTPEFIASFSLEAAQAFHERWYKTDNISIVVHGPVDPQEIKALYQKHIMKLDTAVATRRASAPTKNYPPNRAVFAKQDKAVKLTTVNVERIVHYDNYDNGRLNWARNIVAAYFGTSLPGSPIDKLLNDQGLVSAGSYSLSRLHAGVLRLSFSVNPAPGVTLEQIEQAIETYLKELAKRGIDDKTIERMKQRATLAHETVAKDPPLLAQSLVHSFAARDSYESWLRRDETIAAVTADDVAHVLQALAKPGRQLVGILSPVEGSGAPAAPKN